MNKNLLIQKTMLFFFIFDQIKASRVRHFELGDVILFYMEGHLTLRLHSLYLSLKL